MKMNYLHTWLLAVMITTANLSAGTYWAKLSPQVDLKTGYEIQNMVRRNPGIDTAVVDPNSSTMQFTVKPNTQVSSSQVADLVAQAATGTAMTEPALVETTSGAAGTTVTSSYDQLPAPGRPGSDVPVNPDIYR